MLEARYFKRTLVFKKPAGTSRGVLREKESWYIEIWLKDKPETKGIGECGLLKGLSPDPMHNYENVLQEVCAQINSYQNDFHAPLKNYPSIVFALEQALLDLNNQGNRILFPSAFTQGMDNISINGLIWMDSAEEMIKQADEKIAQGFTCIKMKIGALDFAQEIKVIEHIRKNYGEKIELRLDANGAFEFNDAIKKLKALRPYKIHSIEQPLKKGDTENYINLCKENIIPIALDEELIGINDYALKNKTIEQIKPDYIILKPSLLGGYRSCIEWIDIAQQHQCGWWVTSALESNIGLNAIAQWTYTLNAKMPQGLGTGSLYHNNIISPLEIKNGYIFYNPKKYWQENFEN